MGKWHLIQNQQRLREIFREPPLISYRKGKSLPSRLIVGVVCCDCRCQVLNLVTWDMSKFDSMLPWLSPTKGVPGDPRGLQCTSFSLSPHPLSWHKLKESHKITFSSISPYSQHFISSLLSTFSPRVLPPSHYVPPPFILLSRCFVSWGRHGGGWFLCKIGHAVTYYSTRKCK